MASPSSQLPEGVAHGSFSECFDYLSAGDESTEGCNTPNPSDFAPTRRVQFRPQLTVNVHNSGGSGGGSGAGTGGAAAIRNERSAAQDEVINDLRSQLAALSRRVDGLSLEKRRSPVVIDSGTWTTLTVRSWEHPQVHTSGRVSFSKEFKTTPTVCVSMSAVDVSRHSNFRVRVYATEIGAKGFTAHADSWADTKMHSCEISWIAIGS